MELKPPIVIASGIGGMGEYLKLIEPKFIGAYTLKTITFKPKKGNPPPRLIATENYLINSIGLENPGVENFIEQLKSGQYDELFERVKIIFSFAGDNFEEYEQVAEKMAPFQNKFIAFECNLSCPNVHFNPLSDLTTLKRLLSSLRRKLDIFLIAKLGIEGAFVESIAKLVELCGWDGVTLINTIRALHVDGERIIKGGVSGPILKPIALRAVHEVRSKTKLYIIASGGIASEKDAEDFFKVGANAVSVGTILYKDPSIVERIAKNFS
ncbi:HisA/HisF-related TIM barrel protein [Pseudothermotoga sp.]|nr:HisA/HisF-related TIM barrel protein [Pseudothermotoga sp.]MDW8140540.1 HisA/HisF-related TIM barrel protein [Pseudothermotoga sp.]